MLQLLPHENAGLMVSLCLGTKTTCLELGKKKNSIGDRTKTPRQISGFVATSMENVLKSH